MRRLQAPQAEPTFLTILWELAERDKRDKGGVVVQARLCLAHRKEIALKFPSARGCGQPGDSCDLCEGRSPQRL
ncbi:MAG TPA: hypothetical protein VKL22_04435 [Actinomycetota bacterium]|nr:hypothetical protein [Actinomycetota bacterium]